MKGKKIRVKSQMFQIRNISPWVSKQEQSNRNELQVFLNKNPLVENIQESKNTWTKTKTINNNNTASETIVSENAKTFYKTCTDFAKVSQRSYNRKFYSQSTFLQKEKDNKLEQQNSLDKMIFAKKYKNFRRPKVVKMNAYLDSNLSPLNKTDSLIQKNDPRARMRKRNMMLKKQSFTQTVLKDQIIGHKKFINSLQNCLGDMERVSYNQESNKMLCITLKNYLSRCKMV